MITKTFSGANQVSEPDYLGYGEVLAISISGTFNATIAIQRLILQGGADEYPGPDDSNWNTVTEYTIPRETKVNKGEDVWYRAKCTSYTSGSPKVTMI